MTALRKVSKMKYFTEEAESAPASAASERKRKRIWPVFLIAVLFLAAGVFCLMNRESGREDELASSISKTEEAPMTEQTVLPEPEQSTMEEPVEVVSTDAELNPEQKPDRQDEEMIRISDCISCTAVNDGEEITVPLHLKWVCSHEHGAVLHADGPLMAGLNRPYIVHSTTIPEIKMNADFAIHVEFDRL